MSASTDPAPAPGPINASSDDTASITRSLSFLLSNATYACGGTIPVEDVSPYNNASSSTDSVGTLSEGATGPVTIRWDSSSSIEKVTLPEQMSDPNSEHDSFAKLLRDTTPASFGFKGQDVIDEKYRKASKLDTNAFSTNFNPYEVGIIDVIGQALLPKDPIQTQGIRAELYKLNVYQAPSGFFKPHVDTPRSELQFGSLVVCLPRAHEGGQLVVRHQGQTMNFDWSQNSKDIQWAAFYSDCEHEVQEVTSGHRVTLTYNLYARRGLGEAADSVSDLLVQHLPLHNEFKTALENPLFMPQGGILGKYCSHAYAHCTEEGISALPGVLKGADMVIFRVLQSLGMKARVRPVLDTRDDYHTSDEEGDFLGRVGHALSEIELVEGYDDGPLSEIYEQWDNDFEQINWLNEPVDSNKASQLAYTVYGNQAEAALSYSFCALLFTIPPYHERVKDVSTL